MAKDWDNMGELVLDKLTAIDKKVETLEEKMEKMAIDQAVFKTKLGIGATLISFFTAVIVSITGYFIKY